MLNADDAPPRRWGRTVALVAASLLAGLVLALWGAESVISRIHPIAAAYEFDPVTDYRLRPHQDIAFATAEFSTRIRTNQWGLRGEVPSEVGADDVLLLGDSFAFGHGVEDGEAFPSRLGEELERHLGRPVSVVNTGVPGYDTRREALFFETYGHAWPAGWVVVAFVLNDVGSNSGHFRFSPTATGWLRHLPLPAVGTTVEYLLSDPAALFFQLGLAGRRTSFDHFGCLREGGCPEGWLATERWLARIAETASARGQRLVLVNIPTRQQIELDASLPTYQPERAGRLLEGMAGRLGYSFVDLGREQGLTGAHYFRRDGHWTAEGHRLAARHLAERLAELMSSAAPPPGRRPPPSTRGR